MLYAAKTGRGMRCALEVEFSKAESEVVSRLKISRFRPKWSYDVECNCLKVTCSLYNVTVVITVNHLVITVFLPLNLTKTNSFRWSHGLQKFSLLTLHITISYPLVCTNSSSMMVPWWTQVTWSILTCPKLWPTLTLYDGPLMVPSYVIDPYLSLTLIGLQPGVRAYQGQ